MNGFLEKRVTWTEQLRKLLEGIETVKRTPSAEAGCWLEIGTFDRPDRGGIMGGNMNRPNPKKMPRRAASGMTLPQVAILVVLALLCSAGLFFGAKMLFASPTASPAAAPASPAVSQTEPLSPPTQPADATATAPGPVQMPALPATCALGGKPASQGVVKGIKEDGALEVETGQSTVTVVYAGIELLPSQAGDHPVQRAAAAMLEGQPVLLVRDVTDTDTAGRWVRYVFSTRHFVNYELVRQGFAAAQPASDDRACAIYLLEAQQQARAEGLGGWKVTPIPTSTFLPFVEIEPTSVCDCFSRPECSDFKTRAEAQACYNACNDYNSRLDTDRDGLACEELP
jgi:hypothetical protein